MSVLCQFQLLGTRRRGWYLLPREKHPGNPRWVGWMGRGFFSVEFKQPAHSLAKIVVAAQAATSETGEDHQWCGWRDSNPHDFLGLGILSPLRLPFRHIRFIEYQALGTVVIESGPLTAPSPPSSPKYREEKRYNQFHDGRKHCVPTTGWDEP